MVETILSKVTGQLEKRFVLNALFPTLVFALALALVGAAGRDGVPPAIDKWEGLSAGIQVLLAIGAVGAVFLVANILANGSLTITRIFEGYAFPSCLFAKPARNWQHARAGRKLKKAKSSYLAADHFETTFPVYPREFTPE
ncbi:MAG TPA: hypothetical protein VG458_09435, partial [Solirubrobacterales bacterium]|nr:hypothetical protein [Solirubrobacterales bacterium]